MKSFACILVLLCLAASAFSIGISVGVGASGAYYMTDIKTSNAVTSIEIAATNIPIDFMAFVDITYLQFAAGFQMVNGSHTKITSTILGTTTITESDVTSTLRYLSFAGYGKYPIQLGPITLFPLIGIEYDLTIAGTNPNGSDLTSQQKTDFTEFWLKGGIGADISITPQIYVRPELIVGYKLLSKAENDYVASQKSGGSDASILDLNFELTVLCGLRL